MKVWITRYALSQGILEKDVEDCGNDMVREKGKSFPIYYYGEGKDWHKTKEPAIKKAEEMRQKKIESLKKQIKKLEDLNFGKNI